jgi:hypothetical protein
MALVVTIGVVSLVAILAVATLSLGGRAVQGSSLGIRDARLDAATEYSLLAAVDQWRPRRTGQLSVGSSTSFPVAVPGIPVAATVTTTRISREVFWIVAEVAGGGGAFRRENLIVRLRVPDAWTVIAEDPSGVANIGFLAVDSIAAGADASYDGGVVLSSPAGVVHVQGNATVLGGSGEGILIVEGRLAIVGPFSFSGVIVARGGISVAGPGVAVSGMIRAAGAPAIAGGLTITTNASVVQDVLFQGVRPSIVNGRRWAELF